MSDRSHSRDPKAGSATPPLLAKPLSGMLDDLRAAGWDPTRA